MPSFTFIQPATRDTLALAEEVLGVMLDLLSDPPEESAGVLAEISERRHEISGTESLTPAAVRKLAGEIARVRARFDALGFLPDGTSPADEVFLSPEARTRRRFRTLMDPVTFVTELEKFRALVDSAAASGARLEWSGVS